MIRILLVLFICFGCNNQSKDSQSSQNMGKTVVLPVQVNDSINIDITDSINTRAMKINLQPHLLHLKNGDSFYLNIPSGFHISIAAELQRRLRFLSMSPDGRLFATDMFDRSDNHKCRVLIFESWNETTKRFESITTYLDKLHNPNQLAFYKNYIYIAETGKLRRFKYATADLSPKDSGQTIATFPDYGLSYKYGGWHLTRSIAFKNDKLYVSVGSSCNACIETEALRAAILEMNPDGTDVQFFARGLRNSVAIKWIGNQLWGTGMGRDLIGPDKPEDVFQPINRNGFYGWPFYFQYQQRVYTDDQFKDSARAAWVKEPPKAFLGFKAHSAPLGFEFFKNFEDGSLKNSVLVCQHGSTSVWRQRGNSIVKVESNNRYSEIISGFLTGKRDTDRHDRPCDILMNNQHSFFFTDDLNGVLYYVWK
jgi:glucose/arabinose dehydrogenase